MAFPLNSNNLRIVPDDSGYTIGVHFYLLIMSRNIQKYLGSYCWWLFCIFSYFSPPKSFYNDHPILPKCEISTYPYILFYIK